MSRFTLGALALLVAGAALPMHGACQRTSPRVWPMSAAQRDSGIMQMSFGWVSGLVVGGIAAAAAHNAPGPAKGLAVGAGITAGAVLGVRMFRVAGHWQVARSVAWPLVGAGVIALPLTLRGPCSQRGNSACVWMILAVPLLAAGGASLGEDLAPH